MSVVCVHNINVRYCEPCNDAVVWRATLEGVAHAALRDALQGHGSLCRIPEPRILAADARTDRCPACLEMLASRSIPQRRSVRGLLDQRLRARSDLAELGYNVSKNDRDHRWRILKIAVQEFGARHVIWQLEGHIELRMKQKHGAERYAFAIREWRHDIARVQHEYLP